MKWVDNTEKEFWVILFETTILPIGLGVLMTALVVYTAYSIFRELSS